MGRNRNVEQPRPRGRGWHLLRASVLGTATGAFDAAAYVAALYVAVVLLRAGTADPQQLATAAAAAAALGAIPGLVAGVAVGVVTSPGRRRRPNLLWRLVCATICGLIGMSIPWLTEAAVPGLGEWTDLTLWHVPVALAALSGWAAPTVLMDRYEVVQEW